MYNGIYPWSEAVLSENVAIFNKIIFSVTNHSRFRYAGLGVAWFVENRLYVIFIVHLLWSSITKYTVSFICSGYYGSWHLLPRLDLRFMRMGKLRCAFWIVQVIAYPFPDSKLSCPNIGPTSLLSSQRWTNVRPPYLAVWVSCPLRLDDIR